MTNPQTNGTNPDELCARELHHLLKQIISATQDLIDESGLDAAHKSVATLATLIKTIKDVHALQAQLSSPNTDAGDTDLNAPLYRQMPTDELRRRLTLYLSRLDLPSADSDEASSASKRHDDG